MAEYGKCQRPGCAGGAARRPWFSCPDPEGDCTIVRDGSLEPLTVPPHWARRAVALVAVLALAVLLPPVAAPVWTTNLVQLDNGTCGRNLQGGSDKTASSSALPGFYLMGDGGLSLYGAFIDGEPIGMFHSAGNATVCIATTTPLPDGEHRLDVIELAPRPTMLVAPFAFTVDTIAPPRPTVPILSAYSDSGKRGDAITTYKNVNFTGKAEPGLAIQLRIAATIIGGAKTNAEGRWSATTLRLPVGTYSVFAVSLDPAGNVSARSAARKLIIRP